MSNNISLIISIVCTLLTSIIAVLSYKNTINIKDNEEITERVKRDTTISTKLDMVITSNVELKNEIKSINNKLDDMSERIARCEESTRHAHARIDKLERNFN